MLLRQNYSVTYYYVPALTSQTPSPDWWAAEISDLRAIDGCHVGAVT